MAISESEAEVGGTGLAGPAATGLADPAEKGLAGPAERIRDLKAEQVSLARRKKEVSKQIRNENRKRSRLRQKASKLSNDDLLKVLYSRQQAAEMKGKGKGRGRS